MRSIAKPTLLTNDENKLILSWAQEAGANLINKYEAELATHLQLVAQRAGSEEEIVAHTFVVNVLRTRRERIEELRRWIARYRDTFAKLINIIQMNNEVQMEMDAKDVVAAVRANRRDEKREADHKRIVSDQ